MILCLCRLAGWLLYCSADGVYAEVFFFFVMCHLRRVPHHVILQVLDGWDGAW